MFALVVISLRNGTLIRTRHWTYANVLVEIAWRTFYGDNEIRVEKMTEASYVGI